MVIAAALSIVAFVDVGRWIEDLHDRAVAATELARLIQTMKAEELAPQLPRVRIASPYSPPSPAPLLPVPPGYRCVKGGMVREIPNGFESVPRGVAVRYCP